MAKEMSKRTLRAKAQGKKTYSVGILMVVLGVAQFMGWLPAETMDTTALISDPLTMIMNGLGLGGLRAGVAKVFAK